MRLSERLNRKPGREVGLILGVTAVILLLNTLLPTTWEWDAVVRAAQGEAVAQLGVQWYFASAHYVWLPLWQFLLGGLWFSTGRILPAVKLGAIVSALSAGVLAHFVAEFARIRKWSPGVAVIGMMTSGTFLAYAGQDMTDVLSVLLFFAAVTYLLKYLDTPNASSLIPLVATSVLNSLLRYEAWLLAGVMILFLLLRSLSRRSYRYAEGTIVMGIAIFGVVGSWLYYNYVASGSLFGFSSWIFQSNSHQLYPWYLNIPISVAWVFATLISATGVLWLSLIFAASLKEDWQQVFIVLAGVYLGYSAYSLFAGYSSGWPRQMLYLLPLTAVSLGSPGVPTRFRNFALLFSAVIGVSIFVLNVILALRYSGPCCP